MSLSANGSKLSLVSADFDSLKSSLITFLQSQNTFSDFDFTGSALNNLIDLLCYNTHYNAVYLNMVGNEMFLDTAVLRSTVVSHAKAFGYTPRSATSSVATINATITKLNTDSTSILTMSKFTQFSSDSLDGVSYNFVTLDDITTTASGNTFSFTNIQIKEGSPVTKVFVYNTSINPSQIFDLTDANVDISTLQVIVQTSTTNGYKTNYMLAEDATEVSNTSNVFFVQEGTNGNYEIYFGDGVIGNPLSNGNIVVFSYIVTNADVANGLDTFSLQSNLLSGSTSNITTVAASAGGSPIEDVASIKFSTPKSWVAQNRAVTKNDYIALINKKYPYFDAVNIWGGEEKTPPIYGQVFITAKPKNGYGITQQQIQYLSNYVISPSSVLTVTPQFVYCDYNYLIIDLNVDYDSTQLTTTETQLQNNIVTSVQNYANLNMNTFNSEFKLSRLLRSVDDTDSSIDSSDATVWIEKRFYPSLISNTTYTLNTATQLHRGSTINDRLYSTPSFSILDGGGTTRLSYLEETPNSSSGLDDVNITNSGSGYVSAPTLTIIGDGNGANAYAVIVNGKIQSVVVDKQGSEYTTATITASGGGGSGAAFTANFQQSIGTLRIYYYDDNNNKIILNSSAGTINYDSGVITINNFAPTAISSWDEHLSIVVQPDTYAFSSSQEIIIRVDYEDQTAINVNLNNINDV